MVVLFFNKENYTISIHLQKTLNIENLHMQDFEFWINKSYFDCSFNEIKIKCLIFTYTISKQQNSFQNFCKVRVFI